MPVSPAIIPSFGMGGWGICLPRYLVTVKYPSQTVVYAEDLAYNTRFQGVDFAGKPEWTSGRADAVELSRINTSKLMSIADDVLANALSPNILSYIAEYARALELALPPSHQRIYRDIANS